MRELETEGTVHGKHFNLEGLEDALQTYVDNAAEVWKYDQRAKYHWCKVVGGEQKLLPAHIVNEYCRPDRPFEPCPLKWNRNYREYGNLKGYLKYMIVRSLYG